MNDSNRRTVASELPLWKGLMTKLQWG